MNRKQIICQFKKDFIYGKLKRKSYIISSHQKHPIYLMTKALNYLTKSMALLLQGINEVYDKSSEDGIRYCEELEKSDIFQLQINTANQLTKAIKQQFPSNS